MMTYRHTQTGWVILGSLGGATALVGGVLVLIATRVREPWVVALLSGELALFVFLTWLFSSLTVTVDGEHVEARFGPGWVRFRWKLAEIERCHPVRNAFWMGWGIHGFGRGWLYNVSGMEAVELELRGGKAVRIGTDEPQRLCEAIEAHLGKR